MPEVMEMEDAIFDEMEAAPAPVEPTQWRPRTAGKWDLEKLLKVEQYKESANLTLYFETPTGGQAVDAESHRLSVEKLRQIVRSQASKCEASRRYFQLFRQVQDASRTVETTARLLAQAERDKAEAVAAPCQNLVELLPELDGKIATLHTKVVKQRSGLQSLRDLAADAKDAAVQSVMSLAATAARELSDGHEQRIRELLAEISTDNRDRFDELCALLDGPRRCSETVRRQIAMELIANPPKQREKHED